MTILQEALPHALMITGFVFIMMVLIDMVDSAGGGEMR